MSSLIEFIRARRDQITQQIQALREELAELDRAESALGEHTPPRRRGHAEMTIKDLILDVLADAPNGAESSQILEAIAHKHGVELPRTSMSPQLSRLKEAGMVDQKGKIWHLRRQAFVSSIQDLLE